MISCKVAKQNRTFTNKVLTKTKNTNGHDGFILQCTYIPNYMYIYSITSVMRIPQSSSHGVDNLTTAINVEVGITL